MRASLLCVLFLGAAADAAELRDVDVAYEDGRYSLSSRVWFDADAASVYGVFLDYDLAEKFTSFIVESRNIDAAENGERGFYIRNRGCVWFFCRSFERQGRVEHRPYEYIRSTGDAAQSDFHQSFESWTFEVEDEGTVVHYQFQFEPKFWIPPLIGPRILQRKLERDSHRALDRIEALAQGKSL